MACNCREITAPKARQRLARFVEQLFSLAKMQPVALASALQNVFADLRTATAGLVFGCRFEIEKGESMKHISGLLVVMLLLAPLSQMKAAGQTKKTPVDKTKSRIAKLGVGSKARATIKLNDGTKVKGYLYSAGDEDFVIRNRETDAPTTVRYADVKSVDDNRGHSIARNVLIVVGIGAAVTIAAVFAAIAANER
jgi:hypothetical protein